jgi:hypothetical protein
LAIEPGFSASFGINFGLDYCLLLRFESRGGSSDSKGLEKSICWKLTNGESETLIGE